MSERQNERSPRSKFRNSVLNLQLVTIDFDKLGTTFAVLCCVDHLNSEHSNESFVNFFCFLYFVVLHPLGDVSVKSAGNLHFVDVGHVRLNQVFDLASIHT